MAIGLNDVKRKSARATQRIAKPKIARPSAGRRPWQTPDETTSFESVSELAHFYEFDRLPHDLDASSSGDLLKTLVESAVRERVEWLQKNSYWLARLSHKQSWLARIELFPRVRIPLPSWLSQLAKI